MYPVPERIYSIGGKQTRHFMMCLCYDRISDIGVLIDIESGYLVSGRCRCFGPHVNVEKIYDCCYLCGSPLDLANGILQGECEVIAEPVAPHHFFVFYRFVYMCTLKGA